MSQRSSVVDEDHGYADFKWRMGRLRDHPSVKVGFLEEKPEKNSREMTGEEFAASLDTDFGPLTNAVIAIWMEFGTKTAPERSFMRSTFDERREEYAALAAKLLQGIVDGKMELDRALGILGARVSSDIKKKIASNIPPENAASTLAAKFPKTKTLINTGQLEAGVTWARDDGGPEE